MTPLAGNTYIENRLDALSLALDYANGAIDQGQRREMIDAIREVRRQSVDVLELLEGGQ